MNNTPVHNEEKDFIESITSIQQTPSAILSWSHYERLMRVNNLEARKRYE